MQSTLDRRLQGTDGLLQMLEKWLGVPRAAGRVLLSLGKADELRAVLDGIDRALRSKWARTLWTGQPERFALEDLGVKVVQGARVVDMSTVFDNPVYKNVIGTVLEGVGRFGTVGGVVSDVLDPADTGLDPGGDAANEQGPGDPGSSVVPMGAKLDAWVRYARRRVVLYVSDYRPEGLSEARAAVVQEREDEVELLRHKAESLGLGVQATLRDGGAGPYWLVVVRDG